jgi:hypothetical protein
MDRTLEKEDLTSGRRRLRQETLLYRSKVLRFNGKRAFLRTSNRRDGPLNVVRNRIRDQSDD